MASGYTVEQFEKDLQQLGGMIEGFYGQKGQSGGKKMTKRKTAKRKMNKRRGGAPSETKRAFKVKDVNGHPYRFYRRYKGAEPKDAAKKAFAFICKKLDRGKDCRITFTLQETTRGSGKRTYGPYSGHWKKKAKPRIFIPPGKGKKDAVKITHDRVVELASKGKNNRNKKNNKNNKNNKNRMSKKNNRNNKSKSKSRSKPKSRSKSRSK